MPVGPFNCKAYYLSQRMNAGVRPTRPGHPDRMTHYLGQGFLKFGLNRRNARPLALEAEIIGSIILNGCPKCSGIGGARLRSRPHVP